MVWSIQSTPDPDAFDFGVSFPFDRRLFEDDVIGSLAWAEALAACGALSREDAHQIRDGLTAILEQGRRDSSWVNGDDEDVHSFVERQLVLRIGDAGRRLHTGRSRNEQVSLDLRLYVRRRIPSLQVRIRELIVTLADQAERAGSSLMPSYTHLRRAMPVLVAHYLLSHAAALRRDHDRLAAAAAEADALPLGSGAIAGTGYAIDVHALAARLGFSRVVLNSIDASSDRDFAATFVFACSLAMVHLSRLAEDFILMTSDEFGFFELADRSATGSSMMPQKKNPDPLELVRGKAGRSDWPSRRFAHHHERSADRIQQGPSGRQRAGFRLRGHLTRVTRGRSRGSRTPHAPARTHASRGIGFAPGHGRRRLSGGARGTLSPGTRNRGRHREGLAGEAAGIWPAATRRMAGLQPPLRG